MRVRVPDSRQTPNLYRELHGDAGATPLVDETVRIITTKQVVPHLSTLVSPSDILKTPSCDLRFTSYGRSVDLQGNLTRDADRLDALRGVITRERLALEKDLDAFRAAIDRVAEIGNSST